MIFQSIAGSEKGNRAFGFSAETVDEAQELMRTQGTAAGPNVLYFETGQGSELSSNAHWGADQVIDGGEMLCVRKKISPVHGQYSRRLHRTGVLI